MDRFVLAIFVAHAACHVDRYQQLGKITEQKEDVRPVNGNAPRGSSEFIVYGPAGITSRQRYVIS